MSVSVPLVLVLATTLAAPAVPGSGAHGFAIPDMPDPFGAQWHAPPPPPRPLQMGTPLANVPAPESPTRITSTRPFDPSTPPVMQRHGPESEVPPSKRERRLVYVALGIEAASFVPLGFMIHSAVRTVRARNEAAALRAQNPFAPVPDALARDFRRHRTITLGTAAAAFLMNLAALTLIFVALRRHRRERPVRRITQIHGPRLALWVTS
jgi:hypothetical protein